ncbi:MAG: hydrolase [Deltaproteobacteria bacterium]|nr:hydrolase [Deltaproteobacteria bacterium]
MLTTEHTVLVVIDIQGNLAEAMHEKESLFRNLEILISGTQLLDIPSIITEQIPEKLGPTIPRIASLFSDFQPIAKAAFSCWGEPLFRRSLLDSGRRQVLITGIESHVCVYQTTIDLLSEGYEVFVISDCIASRTPENRDVGIARMREAGGRLSSVEMAIFELLKVAGSETFRQVAKLFK